ncbi:hypothetical protein EIP91_000373 [Steccherinum ochraceum]|uniref:GED domain-containing protein n=1 Tax=Steccherinum ochraceum TaxID=92696 RepID=A0A4R0RWJ4_9APHY|nr:hypothetical protein EIP91_000373 [Steccherinum ochraceum]
MLVDDSLTGVGISASQYARRTGRLIALINELQALGAGTDFSLPRIAVIGNQSAGKSSLVEAISGISLPRATDTCTRCPIECRLEHHADATWQCQVSLRKESEQHKEHTFGLLITEKDELEDMIRRAQLAILNPGVEESFFVTCDLQAIQRGHLPLGSAPQLQFSSDVVCLDITGPDVTNLAFIDLPGIIRHTERPEDIGMIAVVENMVRSHISEKNTLILLTITMSDDINNQGAASLAHEVDPAGSRTLGMWISYDALETALGVRVGVMTKPDLIQQGEHHRWLSILNVGYFVTKQPSPQELQDHVAFSTARERETTFFEGNSPWNEHADLRFRFGIPNLTSELSNLLGEIIAKTLPSLRQDCKESLKSVDEQLRRLPPPTTRPMIKLSNLIAHFCADADRLVQGSDRFESLLRSCLLAYSTFEAAIHRTCPDLRPFIDVNELLQLTGGGEQWYDLEGDLRPSAECMKMYLPDIRDHIQSLTTRSIVPFKVHVSLARRFSKDWLPSSTRCLASVYAATTAELQRLVYSHFGKFESTGLLGIVLATVDEQIEKSMSVARERVEWMLKMEDRPFTLNVRRYNGYKKKYLACYSSIRKGDYTPRDADSACDYGENEAYLPVATPAPEQLTSEGVELTTKSSAQCFEAELTLMAEIAAYFQVSYDRLVDNIPRIIDQDFLMAIMQELHDRLAEPVELDTENATKRAKAYLAEDEKLTLERNNLAMSKDRLDAVQRKLWSFGDPE